MTDITYWQAALLGLIQGATEFLPVSSSGHLALAERLLYLEAESDPILMFDLATHLGTVVSILLVFHSMMRRFAVRLWKERLPAFAGRRMGWRIIALGVLASVPTAAMGLMFKETFERAFGEPVWIGVGLLATGCVLWVAQHAPPPRRGWRRFSAWRAFVIGVAQGIAILPGVSRSGSTISTALLLGIKRRWAAEFSFLIGIPAILGASILKARDIFGSEAVSATPIAWGPTLLGSAVATVVGVVALKLLLGAVRKARLHYFSGYCWLLGVAVILWVR